MPAQPRSQDYSSSFTQPFVPTSMTIRPRPHIKLQTPIYPDKTTNTSGQKRWTTMVIHLIRPFTMHHSTARIALRDRLQRVTRPFTSPFATVRKLSHGTPSPVLYQHSVLKAEKRGKGSYILLAPDTCFGPQRHRVDSRFHEEERGTDKERGADEEGLTLIPRRGEGN